MAAANLGLLMQVSVRVDPLIGDIVSGVKSGEGGVRQAMMKALAEVLGHAATSPSEKSLALVEQCVSEQIAQQRGEAAAALSSVCGAYCRSVSAQGRNEFIRKNTLGSSSGWEHRQQQMSVLAGVLFVCGKVLDDSVLPDIGARVAAALEDDRAPVQEAGLECVRALL